MRYHRGVPTWMQRAVWLTVIVCILYIFISPLPEMDAAFSGKSVLTLFIVLAGFVCELHVFVFTPPAMAPETARFLDRDFLDKLCVMLC